jgi:hypothetical protein
MIEISSKLRTLGNMVPIRFMFVLLIRRPFAP